MESFVERESLHARHPLQDTFGLTDEEYAVLLGDGSDAAKRQTLLAELSLHLGHYTPEERRTFFHEEIPMGAPSDSPFAPRRIPLDVAAEPNGLALISDAARDEVGRRIRANTKVASGEPQHK